MCCCWSLSSHLCHMCCCCFCRETQMSPMWQVDGHKDVSGCSYKSAHRRETLPVWRVRQIILSRYLASVSPPQILLPDIWPRTVSSQFFQMSGLCKVTNQSSRYLAYSVSSQIILIEIQHKPLLSVGTWQPVHGLLSMSACQPSVLFPPFFCISTLSGDCRFTAHSAIYHWYSCWYSVCLCFKKVLYLCVYMWHYVCVYMWYYVCVCVCVTVCVCVFIL